MRDVECIVYFGTPQPGYQQIVRMDTNEVVREIPMTQAEMQAVFSFEPGDGERKH